MVDKSLKFLIFGSIILTIVLLSGFRASTDHRMISEDLVLLGIINVKDHHIAYAQSEEEEEEDGSEKKDEDKEDNDNVNEETGNRAVVGNGVDKFGIEKLYPTKTGVEGGEEWYMDM